jgi:hypothetical protein
VKRTLDVVVAQSDLAFTWVQFATFTETVAIEVYGICADAGCVHVLGSRNVSIVRDSK